MHHQNKNKKQRKQNIQSRITHVRQNDISPNSDQVVDPDSGPFLPTLFTTNPELGRQLPGLVEEQPHVLALFHHAPSARLDGAVEEDERDDHLGRLDPLLDEEKLTSESLSFLCLPGESGFGHYPRRHHRRVRAESPTRRISR